MDKKYIIPSLLLTMLLSATFVAAMNRNVAATRLVANSLQAKAEAMKEKVPATFEEAEKEVYPVKRRFLMWTHNGEHIMWGHFGNGLFTGEDNHDVRVWGIYGKHVFAGFYKGEFFYGRYFRGRWSAYGLFGENYSRGKFVTFPAEIPVAASISEMGG